MSKYLGFAGHRSAVLVTHLCHWRAKAAVGDMHTNGCVGVPIKLYLQKQATGHIWPVDHSLVTHVLERSQVNNNVK